MQGLCRLTIMLLCAATFSVLAGGCAQVGSPLGGPADKRGPRLQKVSPPHRSVNINPKEVMFTFDEFLLVDGVAKEVFMSPVPTKRPDVFALNKRLQVKFKEPLLPNRTYVITLERGIKDFTEKNSIPEVIQYAFSTGPTLSTGAIAGKLIFPPTGRGEKGFTVGLYDADSVREKGLYKLRPLYAADADTLGRFVLSYLPLGNFILFGFKDADRSYTYNSPGEKIAYDYSQSIRISADTLEQARDLYTFLPDTVKPLLRSVDALSERLIRFSFSEMVTQGTIACGPDTLRWRRGDIAPYTDGPYDDGDMSRVVFMLSKPFGKDSLQFAVSATDSIGNRVDTLATKRFKTSKELNTELKVVKARQDSPDPFTHRFYCNSPLTLRALAERVQVLDSAKKPVAVKKRLAYNDFYITLPPGLDSTAKLTLKLDSLLQSIEGFVQTKPQSISLKYPNTAVLGTLRGGIDTETDSLLLVLSGIGKNKRRYYSYGRQFNFENVLQGEYELILVEDRDNNHRWTPGRLVPLQLPESVYIFPDKIKIKGGLEADGLTLTYPPK
jgi:hypothetical protein